MRIAIITSSYPRFEGDGNASFVRSMADNLVAWGNKVDVVAPYDPAVKSIEANGVNLHWFKYIWPKRFHILGHARALKEDVKLRPMSYFLLPLFLLSGFIKLLTIVRKNKCDVIHVNWVIPNGVIGSLVSFITGLPFIISLHGSDVYLARNKKLFGLTAGFIFRHAKIITACSPELREGAIALGADPAKTVIQPNGADPTRFTPEKKGWLRHEYINQKDTILVVALGRLVHKKGFNILLQAWEEVEQACNNVTLVIGGDGPLNLSLAKQAKDLNLKRVYFAGRIPWERVPAFLAAADIFVLPSIRDAYGNMDGLPTVLLEAMSSGVAIVASNIGGVPIVVQNHKNGLLVPEGDNHKLSAAIIELVANPSQRAQMGVNARLAVVEQYNWRNLSKILLNLFGGSF